MVTLCPLLFLLDLFHAPFFNELARQRALFACSVGSFPRDLAPASAQHCDVAPRTDKDGTSGHRPRL